MYCNWVKSSILGAYKYSVASKHLFQTGRFLYSSIVIFWLLSCVKI